MQLKKSQVAVGLFSLTFAVVTACGGSSEARQHRSRWSGGYD